MSELFHLDVSIPNDRVAAQDIQEQIIALIESQGFVPQEVFSIRLGIEEAVINAIKHGNKRHPAKSVRVECSIGPNHVVVVVEDEGSGFDPGVVPDCTSLENLEKPSGRGIALMKNFLTAVEYNDVGNRVTLTMERSKGSETAL